MLLTVRNDCRDTYINPAETGFYYLKSRYYDPEIGRFINADGLVSTGTGLQGYNMYAYCNDNPVRYRDSYGNCITNARGDNIHYNCKYRYGYDPYVIKRAISTVSNSKYVIESSAYFIFSYAKESYSTVQRPSNIGEGIFVRTIKTAQKSMDNMWLKTEKIIGHLDTVVALWEISNNCCENVINDESATKIIWDFTVDAAILSANIYMATTIVSTICPGLGSVAGFLVGVGVDMFLEYLGEGAREELKAWVN